MRHSLLCALLACSACSLIYSTDDLRSEATDGGPDGSAVRDSAIGDTGSFDTGITDTGITDTGMVDASMVDASMVDASMDGPCLDTIPEPQQVVWDTNGNLTITFRDDATRDVMYVLNLGDEDIPFILRMGGRTMTDHYMVPLFRTSNTLNVRSSDRCVAAELSVTVDTTRDYANTAEATVQGLKPPSMDITDDGTAVFIANTVLGAMTPGDRFYRWGPFLEPEILIMPGGGPTRFGPRISDDGRVVTYWQGNFETVGQYHYRTVDSSGMAHAGVFDIMTGSVSSDLRGAIDGNYAMTFVDSAQQLQIMTFDEAPPSMLAMQNVMVDARAPTITLSTGGTYTVAYTNMPSGTGAPSTHNGTTATAGSGCRVDGNVGLVATLDGGGIAFVGQCSDDTVDSLYFGPISAVVSHALPAGGVDGLLAASRDGEVFLAQKSATPTTPGEFWVYSTALDDWHPLSDEDGSSPTPAPAWSPFLDGAALSPNGNWAMFANQSNSTAAWSMIRIRVR